MFSNLKIMRPNPLLILLTSMMCLVGCETTGDPAQGGLFGWSQSKADQRVYEKQRELYRVQADNNRQQQRSSALRSSYDSLR
jgi:hypothetical protein